MRTALQDDLFSNTRWLERRTSANSVVRVLLEPLGAGRVRIVRYERRRAGETGFRACPDEVGTVVDFARVAPGRDYHEFFRGYEVGAPRALNWPLPPQ